MVCVNRSHSAGGNRMRRASSVAPIVVVMGFFAVVLGVLFFTVNRNSPKVSADNDRAASGVAVLDELSRNRETSDGTVANVATSDISRVDQVLQIAAKDGLPPSQPADLNAAQTSLEKLKAQLSAGEFGPALETAQATWDAHERTQMLKLVAEAQMNVGEFDAAMRAIRRMPIAEQRVWARGERVTSQSLAGGSMADFESLIELIKSQTSGDWEETTGDEGGGTIDSFDTGVRVDPNGVLFRLSRAELTGRLKALGIKARVADLNEDMAQQSSLRLVSLTRLEREVAKRIAAGQPVLETMKRFAGLSQIQYIFVYPEQNEIVIGGPAEGWKFTANGIPVGVESGRPTLQLDDFVTVLRTFTPGGLGMFQCLIVPRQEELKSLMEFVAKSNKRGSLGAGAQARNNWVRRLQKRLGMQDVVVNGIPDDSRVARAIVEADYRMKLIGIGKLDGGSIPSYFDLLPPGQKTNQSELSALRWWLTMKYDAVLHSTDHNVFAIRGSSVRCRSENEMITDQGERIHTGKSEVTNRLFAQNFTKQFAELAKRDLVFADLQNIFDLALVTALLRQERLDERVDWNLGAFAAGGEYRPATYEPAKTVMSTVNHRTYYDAKDDVKNILVQVAGGVRADLMTVLTDSKIFKEAVRLGTFADRGRAPALPEGRWWWDAAE